jgi:hypothetical protein
MRRWLALIRRALVGLFGVDLIVADSRSHFFDTTMDIRVRIRKDDAAAANQKLRPSSSYCTVFPTNMSTASSIAR